MDIKEQMREKIRDASKMYDDELRRREADPNIEVDCIVKIATTMFIQSHRARSVRVPVIPVVETVSNKMCEGCDLDKRLAENVIEYSTKTYGRRLCFKCQEKEKEK